MSDTDRIRLDGRVAIVTGAGTGIGRAIALDLASRGAALVVNDYGGDWRGGVGTSARVDKLVSEIADLGVKVVGDPGDVSDEETPARLARIASAEFGQCDILVNNAGVTLAAPFDTPDRAALTRVIDINLHGAWRMMQAVWPLMREQGFGRIVNLSSNAVLGGYGQVSAYAASKGGVMGLTADAATEGLPLGILVNALVPIAYTRMAGDDITGPGGAWIRWLRDNFPARQIAPVAIYLASPANRDVTGEMFCVGGGRVSRLVFANNTGFAAGDLTSEAVAAHIAQIRDTTAIVPLTCGGEDSARYMTLHPYDPDSGEAGDALSADQIDIL